MLWLIIYPLLTAFVLGFIKDYIKEHIDLIVLSIFTIYLFIVAEIATKAWANSLEYSLGNWGQSLGIRLHLASDGVFMVSLVAGLIYLVLVYASSYITEQKYKYYLLICILTASLMGLILTADLFNLYVFFEIASITSYALAAVNMDSNSFEGVLKYLVVGSFSAIFILLAIILTYQTAGTLDLAQLGLKIGQISTFKTGTILSLLLIGFGAKLALIPLHAWMPDLYNNSNITFNALSSALIAKAVLYSLFKILYTAFRISFLNGQLQSIILWWGTVTFLTAHLLASQQQNIKRLLAYSSIAHIGYLITVFSLGNKGAIIAANFHLLNHALMKTGLFLISGILAYQTKSYQLNDWRGLAQSLKYPTLFFTIISLAMVGLPPFNGFISKWLMVEAIIEAGYYNIAFAVLIGTILSLYYYLKVIKVLYTKEGAKKLVLAPKRLRMVTFLLTTSCIALGLWPTPILNLVKETVILLGG